MIMQKISKVHDLMESSGIDAMIISSPINFCYASGIFDSTAWMLMNDALLDNCVIVPKGKNPVLLVNAGLFENAKRESFIDDVRTLKTGAWVVRSSYKTDFADTLVQGINEVLKENNLQNGRIGMEMKYMRVAVFNLLRDSLRNADFCDIGNILNYLRCIKTPEEVVKLRRAALITETAMKESFAFLQPGFEDGEVIKKLKMVVNNLGGDISHASWGIGPRSGEMFSSAYGHRATTGDVVRFDIGVRYQGYVSDIARTGVVGKPSDKLGHIYESLLEGQRAAIRKIRPGEKLSSVYQEAIDTVRKFGYRKYVRHMIGHSIGLNCEEEPFICSESTDVLLQDMVFSVELSWYEPGLGGIAIEDMVLVTEYGCEEISNMDRSLYYCSL